MEITAMAGKLIHGGDYNPDQWLKYPEVLEEDIRLMKKAKINCVTLGVFSWASLEPEEGKYDFGWLSDTIDHLFENGIYTILATPTGAMPHWMTQKYDEVLKVTEEGLRRFHGERHNFCPSSPVMRKKSWEINTRLAERFGNHPGLAAWHISNEYGGCDGGPECHCQYCQGAFRDWLKKRYQSLEKLNDAWWAAFWGNLYTDWGQIHSPSSIGENQLHGLKLDWSRFANEQLLDFCKEEVKAVRQYSNRPVTVNMMGTFKPLNYFQWAKEVDIVSLDSYPAWHALPKDDKMGMMASINYNLTRSLKKQPFLLMESVPSAVNWMSKNILKRPGMHELSSLQAVSCGADSVQYFQWRKGRGGVEKYHGAVIDHKNGGDTRVFRDVTRVGERLERIAGQVKGTCNRPKIAIVFDWENWWAVDNAKAVINPFDYKHAWVNYYQPFWEMGIDVDLIDMESDLDGYCLVVAPINYMYRGDYAERVRQFVKAGGTYVTTYWSGEVNETDLCFIGSHPLEDVLGIRVEETDVMPEYVKNQVAFDEEDYQVTGICALVHTETAECLAVYKKDFYEGYPALTRNRYGAGMAYFIASENEIDFLRNFFGKLLEKLKIGSTFQAKLPEGVTVSERAGQNGSVYFLQNFNAEAVKVICSRSYCDIENGRTFLREIHMNQYECLILVEGA